MKLNFKIIFVLLLTLFIMSCGSEENTDPDSNLNPDNNIEIVTTPYDANVVDSTKNIVAKKETASSWVLVVLIIFAVIFVIFIPIIFWYYIPLGLWYEAWLSGVRASWIQLVKMRFQKIPQELVLKTLITAHNAGLKLKTSDMMEKYLAGVDIVKVTSTAIRATNAGIEVSYNELAAQFLAKVDVETIMHALITGRNAELDITLKQLASQYLANVDIMLVVEALITAHNAGYDDFTLNDLKEHYLANGNVAKTVDAFIAAREADYHDVKFKDIAAIDLSGIDVKQAVHSAIKPKVVQTGMVVGIAGDGVQLHMRLKLTLRANLKNFIGGAGEETVLARIDESLATEIGRSKSHYDVLESPFKLADEVEKKNLGEGTAYDVISVDVSEITVGKDVHSELKTERAHADAAKARADLIKAEETVQKAMAAAFLDGNLSIHDFHEIQNTEADTHMRKKLGDSAENNDHNSNDDHHHDDHHHDEH